MKKRIGISAKLNSQRGASIFYGLIMMLVVAMISGVLISAALTSAKSKKDDFDNQQAFLTVSSAAKVVRNQIDGKSTTNSTTFIFKNDIQVGNPNVEFTDEPGGKLSELLLRAVEYVNIHDSAFKMDMSVRAHGHENVIMQFVMDEEYNIKITFTLQDVEDRISPILVLSLKNIASKEPNVDTIERPNGEIVRVENKSVEWMFEEIK